MVPTPTSTLGLISTTFNSNSTSGARVPMAMESLEMG